MYEKAQLRSDFRKNISLAGAPTHESDYFCTAHYLGCKPVMVNLFYHCKFLQAWLCKLHINFVQKHSLC